MAASTTPRPSPRPRPSDGGDALIAALAPLAPRLPLAVALSGGADSTTLLLACQQRFPGQVAAIHVHHGLQVAADGFEAHVRALCAQRGVPLAVRHVDARHRRGESPEDAARRARYAALVDAARSPIGVLACRCVVVAQHADDQVETVLLALSRGAGLPGLSGMRPRWQQQGVCFERPWLAIPGPDIRAWLQRQGVAPVEDPTNADPAFTRNRIRLQWLPLLEQAFPALRTTVARSAAHAAQAQELLDALAADDLVVARPVGAAGPRLDWLQSHTRARQANLLRHWLRQAHGCAASQAQMDELLDQVQACRTRGHAIRLRVGSGRVEREGAELAWYNAPSGRAYAE